MTEPNQTHRFDVSAEINSSDHPNASGDGAYDLIMPNATAPQLLRALADQLESTIRESLWSPAGGDVGHVLVIRIWDAGVHFDQADRVMLATDDD